MSMLYYVMLCRVVHACFTHACAVCVQIPIVVHVYIVDRKVIEFRTMCRWYGLDHLEPTCVHRPEEKITRMHAHCKNYTWLKRPPI